MNIRNEYLVIFQAESLNLIQPKATLWVLDYIIKFRTVSAT
jgi:hypothetical protein